jgi:hypothetical protein
MGHVSPSSLSFGEINASILWLDQDGHEKQ